MFILISEILHGQFTKQVLKALVFELINSDHKKEADGMQIPSLYVISNLLLPVFSLFITTKSKVGLEPYCPAILYTVIPLTRDTFSSDFSFLSPNILIVCGVKPW